MEAEARVRFGPSNGSDYRLLGFAGICPIGCASCVKDFGDGQLLAAG